METTTTSCLQSSEVDISVSELGVFHCLAMMLAVYETGHRQPREPLKMSHDMSRCLVKTNVGLVEVILHAPLRISDPENTAVRLSRGQV